MNALSIILYNKSMIYGMAKIQRRARQAPYPIRS